MVTRGEFPRVSVSGGTVDKMRDALDLTPQENVLREISKRASGQQGLQALGAFTHPHIAAEIERLYALERDHAHALEEMADLRRQLHRAATMAGENRGRLASAEARLEDLRPDEIAKARRDALFTGAGYIKVTSLGRQRYATEHVPSEKVIIRG